MATLWELFKGESRHLKLDTDFSFTADGVTVGTFPAQLSLAFDEFCCFLAYYVPEELATRENLETLIGSSQHIVDDFHQSVVTTTRHEAYEPEIRSTDLPFSTRTFLYVDAGLEDDVKQRLIAYGLTQGVHVQIRDRRYEAFLTEHETPRAFISHDSRDKPYVEKLAERLRIALCPIWYDAFSLKPGDSLRESIDAGLRDSRRCVVVLSPNFFTNPGWGKGEFNAMMNKHFAAGGNVLIPVWHGVTRDEVADYSPLVVDICAINTNIGEDEVFNSLYRVLMADPPPPPANP